MTFFLFVYTENEFDKREKQVAMTKDKHISSIITYLQRSYIIIAQLMQRNCASLHIILETFTPYNLSTFARNQSGSYCKHMYDVYYHMHHYQRLLSSC